MTLSHSFLEGSTAEAVIQEGEHWFWGGPIPNQVVQLSLSDPVWLNEHVEKSWSSLVLIPASGKASFDSSSESRVYYSGGSGTDTYIYLTTTAAFDFKGHLVHIYIYI
jgi:hypothetical protein